MSLSSIEALAAERPKPLAWRVIVAELLVLVVGLGLTALLRQFTTVDGVQAVLDRIVGDAPIEVTVQDVDVVPWSHWYDPSSWQLCLSGVRVEDDRVTLRAERLVLGTPDLMRAWATRKLRFETLRIVGLKVDLTPGKPKEWTPKKTALDRILADRVEVWDATVHVAADGPVPAVDVRGISGDLARVQYAPGTREIWGRGRLTGRSFDFGGIDLHRLVVDDVIASGSTIQFGRASFSSGKGGGTGVVKGWITSLQRDPAVEVELDLSASVAHVVETATGRKSPLDGRLSAHLQVHAGGQLGPGGAWMSGHAELDGGIVTLGDDVKPILIDLLHVAPFVRVDKKNRLHLEPMSGNIAIRRGRVDVENLEYRSPKSTIQLRGQIEEGAFGFVIRLLPAEDAKAAVGVGLVVQGEAEALRVRLATRTELNSGEISADPEADGKRPFWLKFGGKPKEGEGRRVRLPSFKKGDKKPP